MFKGKTPRANGKPIRRPARVANGSPCEPLSTRRVGEDVRVVEVEGSAALKRRLRHLGLRPGKSIRVRQKSPAGMVVTSRGLKLALGRDATEHIMVATDDGKA